ncbi:sulfotransferase family 2 domain-containing protein [Tamlana sp. 2_MG-2023]|uniref:sulfotransferase family 2 domain-containing protein n=1 Tax=unclassified Tamlana TaxID=2614803 RepID=UPI0026E31955|nr:MULTISPECIES: sulfotransferase family 2 domain-containing protein [unclassified Tamlana]MDO6760238.1 sulfotransferase family 2 domain-containing protein [Tamlana sp. 2_MG-2023]MDO6790064.1 sulfotransferase family 2 domain-containing protein [Tamlana sp. 1_MG-2023]
MISHKHKCIFIHIPKTAGSSINKYLTEGKSFDWRIPNYEYLYGWCPERQIHMQHATAKQMLELELVTQQQWDEYYKFTFVRNPWDRAYSDYLWVMKDTGTKGSFEDFLLKKGGFSVVLSDKTKKEFRGDHLLKQTEFFDTNKNQQFSVNKVGRFENLKEDLSEIKEILGIKNDKKYFEKKNSNKMAFYDFYQINQINLVKRQYQKDIDLLEYNYPNIFEIISRKLKKKLKL